MPNDQAETVDGLRGMVKIILQRPDRFSAETIAEAVQTAADLIATQADKIEGLTCDLRMAVETAYKRGATEWTRLNYPKWFAEFEAAALTEGPQ